MQDQTVVVQNLAEIAMNEHQQPKSEQSENLWHDEPAKNAAIDRATTAFSVQ